MSEVLTCQVPGCDEVLVPAGKGPAPKWCPTHRNSRAARPQKRDADHRRFQAKKKRCRCGNLRSERATRCVDCKMREADRRRARIEALWATGVSIRAIADELGSSLGSVSVQIVVMRSQGYNLPYRYHVEDGRRVA